MLANTGATPKRLLDPDTFLTRDRAAEVLTAAGIPTSRATLEQLAVKRAGPPYSVVNGRAIYRRADLEAWIKTQTSDAAVAAGAA